MDKTETNWALGEIVKLPQQNKKVSKDGIYTFGHFVDSKYVCIRPAIDDHQRGILVKVLGKRNGEDFLIKGGEPFCKDEKVEGFNYNMYYSFRFPATDELVEVLDIIRKDQKLQDIFEQASMHINVNSTFWVRETSRKYLFKKTTQYYDASTGECIVADGEGAHYRLTIVYFYKSELNW